MSISSSKLFEKWSIRLGSGLRVSVVLRFLFAGMLLFQPHFVLAESPTLLQDQNYQKKVSGNLDLAPPTPRPSFPESINSDQDSRKKDPEKNNDQAFDFGAPPATKTFITPTLSFGGRAGLEYVYEKDFNLESRLPEDLSIFQPSLSLAFSYNPSDYFSIFVNVESSGQIIDDQENKRESKAQLLLNQAFVSYSPFKNSLRINAGRQRIRDERQWIYDAELDALRLTYGHSIFALDFSISESNGKDILHDDNDPETTNFMSYGKVAFAPKNELSLYFLVQDDRSANPENLTFYGLQMNGEIMKRTEYWVEFAHVRGRTALNSVRGYGFDIGLTKVFKAFLKPSITFGFAYGSGDGDTSDNKDKNFRQTGLQDNNASFNGVTRIQYYGELVDPELSNLSIATVGMGLRFNKKSSLDFIYHYFQQNHLAKRLRDTQLEDRPNGISKDLGHEFDLVAGYRNRKSGVTASLILGYFIPGDAFPDDADDALFLEAKLRYDF